jgi:4-hydroxybenzoate polyprenyltransferase
MLTRLPVTFGVNDVYDIESDMKNPRKKNKWTHGTALPAYRIQALLWAARVLTGVVLILALPASANSAQVLWCTIGLLSVAWGYSTPPVRFKERPVLDSLANGLLCWLFWASGYTFSGQRSLVFDTIESATNGRLVFLLASAMHSLAAVEDAETDALVEYRTIATVCGERFAIGFSHICL